MKKQINYKKLGVIISIVFGILGSGFGLKAIYSAVKICDIPAKIESQKAEFDKKIESANARITCIEKSQSEQKETLAYIKAVSDLTRVDVQDIRQMIYAKRGNL